MTGEMQAVQKRRHSEQYASGPGESLLGYRRIHGELLVLGIRIAASTVWEILQQAGIDPAPERTSTTWADFLRSQAGALLACDYHAV